MRQVESTSSDSRRYLRQRTIQEKHTARSKSQEESCDKIRKPGNDFLRATFSTRRRTDIDPTYSEDRYDFLYKTAQNYVALIGKKFDHQYNPTDFKGLFSYFEETVCDTRDAYLICRENKEEHRLYFELQYQNCCNMVSYIPCYILSIVNDDLSSLMLDFFRHMFDIHNMRKFDSTYDGSMLQDEVEYCDSEDEACRSYEEEFLTLAKSYLNGEIGDMLTAISEPAERSLTELKEEISSYSATNEFEKELFPIMVKGIEFLETGRSYLNCFIYDESDDGNYPISPDRLVLFMHKNDSVAEWMLENLNGEAESGCPTMIDKGHILLTPDTKDALVKDTFVDEFAEWLSNFISLLYKYE